MPAHGVRVPDASEEGAQSRGPQQRNQDETAQNRAAQPDTAQQDTERQPARSERDATDHLRQCDLRVVRSVGCHESVFCSRVSGICHAMAASS